MATSKKEARSGAGGGGGGGGGNATTPSSSGHKRQREASPTSPMVDQQHQHRRTPTSSGSVPSSQVVLPLPSPSHGPSGGGGGGGGSQQQTHEPHLQEGHVHHQKRILMIPRPHVSPTATNLASPYGAVTPPHLHQAMPMEDLANARTSISASVLQAHRSSPMNAYNSNPKVPVLPYPALPPGVPAAKQVLVTKRSKLSPFIWTLKKMKADVINQHLIPFLDMQSLLAMSESTRVLINCRNRITEATVYGRRRFSPLLSNISKFMYPRLTRITCHALYGPSTAFSLTLLPIGHTEAKVLSNICCQGPPSPLNNLEALTLNGHQNLLPESFTFIFEGLCRLTNFRYLDLTGTPIDTEGCRSLGRCMQSGSLRLETLILARCRIKADGVTLVVNATKHPVMRGTLRHLDLAWNEVQAEALRGLLLPNLKHLDLSSHILGKNDKRVSDVVVALSQVINKQGLPSLESLLLNGSCLPDSACHRLAAALASPSAPSLQTFEVEADCNDGRRGWRTLCQAIKTGPSRTSLTRLKIASDMPTDDGVRAVAELLVEGACENLDDLDLHGDSLGDDKLRLFLDIVQWRRCPLTLKKLVLSQNNLTGRSAEALAHAWAGSEDSFTLWQGLEEMVLEDNMIDSSGGTLLARAFGHGALPSLKVLNLNFNKLSDTAVEDMIQALKVDCTHWGLRRVELVGNSYVRHAEDLRRTAYLRDPPNDNFNLSRVLAHAFVI